MNRNRRNVPARVIRQGIGLTVLAVLFCAATMLPQTATMESDLQQVESELEDIKNKLEEKTENLEKLTEKEQQATVKSRSIREEMELLEEVRNRLNHKYHTLNKELSTTQQNVRKLEETYAFRREVLARTLTAAYTAKAVSDATALGNHGSGAERRRYFTRLVSLAQVDRIQQAADSMTAGENRREELSVSQQKVKTAAVRKEKEKEKKERLLAKSEREAFGYRQQREQELDDLEEIHREALILSELIDRLAALPGVQNAIDYDFPGWKGNLHWPLSGTVKSTVGKTIDPKYHTETFESGIFISGKPGARVVNAGDGEIAYAGRRRGLGNVVVVGHGSGYFSIFAHLSEIAVLNGQVVRAGEPIGTAGESHPRFGPGILFELRHEKEILDPLEWLK